jgi:hypothetical protein
MGFFGRLFGGREPDKQRIAGAGSSAVIQQALFPLLVAACSHAAPKPELRAERPVVELAAQPAIANGFRNIYAINLAAIPPRLRPAALIRAERTIRTRLQLAGIVSRVTVGGPRPPGIAHAFPAESEQIVVDLAPAEGDALARATDLIGRSGHVELRFVDTDSAFMKTLWTTADNDARARAQRIAADVQHWETAEGQHVAERFLQAANGDRAVTAAEVPTLCPWMKSASGDHLVCYVSGRAAIERYVADAGTRDPTLVVPSNRELAYQDLGRSYGWRTYLLERTAAVTGTSIVRASVGADKNDGPPTFQIELDRAGAAALAASTANHAGHKQAIVVDGRVWTAAIVDAAITGGRISISSGMEEPPLTDPEPDDMAILMTAGELPAPLTYLVHARLVDGVPQDAP